MELMTFILPLVSLLFLSVPLIFAYRRVTTGGTRRGVRSSIIVNLCGFFGVALISIILFSGNAVYAAEAAAASATGDSGLGFLAAALATGLSAIGAGIAVAASVPAAIGAMSENPKSFGKSLIFVGLGEGVALYGLLISILILNKI